MELSNCFWNNSAFSTIFSAFFDLDNLWSLSHFISLIFVLLGFEMTIQLSYVKSWVDSSYRYRDLLGLLARMGTIVKANINKTNAEASANFFTISHPQQVYGSEK
jgi:hypothetical protein